MLDHRALYRMVVLSMLCDDGTLKEAIPKVEKQTLFLTHLLIFIQFLQDLMHNFVHDMLHNSPAAWRDRE